MILKAGVPIIVKGKEAYFQKWGSDGILISYEDGTLAVINVYDVIVRENPKDNIIREFIEYAVENQVAPTDLVNLALKAIE